MTLPAINFHIGPLGNVNIDCAYKFELFGEDYFSPADKQNKPKPISTKFEIRHSILLDGVLNETGQPLVIGQDFTHLAPGGNFDKDHQLILRLGNGTLIYLNSLNIQNYLKPDLTIDLRKWKKTINLIIINRVLGKDTLATLKASISSANNSFNGKQVIKYLIEEMLLEEANSEILPEDSCRKNFCGQEYYGNRVLKNEFDSANIPRSYKYIEMILAKMLAQTNQHDEDTGISLRLVKAAEKFCRSNSIALNAWEQALESTERLYNTTPQRPPRSKPVVVSLINGK